MILSKLGLRRKSSIRDTADLTSLTQIDNESMATLTTIPPINSSDISLPKLQPQHIQNRLPDIHNRHLDNIQNRHENLTHDANSTDESSVFDSIPESTDDFSIHTSKTRPTSCYVTPPLPQDNPEFPKKRLSFRNSSSVSKRSSLYLTPNISPDELDYQYSNHHRQSLSIDKKFQLAKTVEDDEIPKRSNLRPASPKLRPSPLFNYPTTPHIPKNYSDFISDSPDSSPSPYPSPSLSIQSRRPSTSLPQITSKDLNSISPLQNLDRVLNHKPPVDQINDSSISINTDSTVKPSYIPKLNKLESILKLKLYLGSRNESVMALKLKKDKLDNIDELIDVLIYKIIEKFNNLDLSANQIKISIFFKNPKLKSIIMKNFGPKEYNDEFSFLQKELLMDYISNKDKLYIRAEFNSNY
ncbi:hypothetical protein HYPBUDRAFT_242524 [Hyphopichia burtonii NRRL Y-1933]|uniref:Uncharacterized protein n=1 Tax=Hyphopichia burtonii NRRL Y-1933 TaxID=984485 RepID=A0A1E4RF69_9ASCO|nr:hypothetical protein HYPBUDRAFT_242524 [Hyphopichia burtonii NRRL Y-1933]ODV65912.1 hypothetical protein HYPBUDRAFT_242524 [Hyphopichia burtonii NRRL Y-1933]